MQIQSQQILPKDPSPSKSTEVFRAQNATHRYGQNSVATERQPSLRLSIPSETLAHITSFLDPSTLFSVSLSNKQLYLHVSDDNTWQKAFNFHFLGVGPESHIDSNRGLLLRRTQSSWRREYVLRCIILQRWEQSCNKTNAHMPHDSPVSSMHIMSGRSNSPSLLTSSLQYGIVSRSLPLTGKILKGFIDASGTANGFGIGNPNVEFTPNVSACALTSDGDEAKILWGYTSGKVAVTTAACVMDAEQAAAKLERCEEADQHSTMVIDAVWMSGETFFVTVAADGVIKVWETKRMRCVWSSTKRESAAAGSCVKVIADRGLGIIVVAMQSGELVIWSGLAALLLSEEPQANAPDCVITSICVPLYTSEENDDIKSVTRPTVLVMDPRSTTTCVSFAVHYSGDPGFYRLTLDLVAQRWQRIHFTGDICPIRSLFPAFAISPSDASAVLTGDQLGQVSIYNWSTQPSHTINDLGSVSPARKFTAHDDCAITALSFNSIVLVTGSERGDIKVWDVFPLRLLRTFSSPATRSAFGAERECVNHVILERDLLVVSVGSHVMAWKAGPNLGQKSQKAKKDARKAKSAGKAKRGGTAKWHEQHEMRRDIAESKKELEDERKHSQKSYSREREQLSALAHLGLNEVEMLDYVLMLSRDEEQSRTGTSSSLDGGVFEDDFQDIPLTQSHLWIPPSLPLPSLPVYPSLPEKSYPSHGSAITGHNSQVPLRNWPELTEAGPSSNPWNHKPLSSSAPVVRDIMTNPLSIADEEQFPAINPSVSTPASLQCSLLKSPETRKKGWSSVLRSNTALPNSSPEDTIPHFSKQGPSLLSASIARHAVLTNEKERTSDEFGVALEDNDAELKYAIELSLAETESQSSRVAM